jgi:hypothetical protein
MSLSKPLPPKLIELVRADRLDRPVPAKVTPANVKILAKIARDPRSFEAVSAPRAIQALARAAKPSASIPVLRGIVADPGAPTVPRITAARELGSLATPAAQRALLANLDTGAPRVLEAVLRGIGAFAGPAALRELMKLGEQRDVGVRRQLALARALIAHRHGLDGPFLPAVAGRTRTKDEIEHHGKLTLRLKTARSTAADLRRLVGTRYGIEIAPRGADLACAGADWLVLFHRDLAPDAVARRLFDRPWIAALLARWYIRDKAAVVHHLVLTRPEGRSALISVVRADGELMYAGRAVPDGRGVSFTLADVDRPGAAPVNIEARISAKGIELLRVVASSRRVGVRVAQPASGS